MAGAYVYDYYFVHLPADLEESDEKLADMAINEAGEKARLWCIPATWTAQLYKANCCGQTIFKVSRKRYKGTGRKKLKSC